MIYLYTDFGSSDIYLGQVKAALLRHAPDVEIVDLCNDLPPYAVQHSAHLLAALLTKLSDQRAVLVCVVDPGVGSDRRPLALQADGRWLVGPDNGLLSVVMCRASASRCYEILWRPEALSRTFHGRDLFAPMAAMLACDVLPPGSLREISNPQLCDTVAELAEVIYIDHYGNALTGIRAQDVPAHAGLQVAGQLLRHAGTFVEAAPGQGFWYENSLGLVEIAVNQGCAADMLGLQIGSKVVVSF